MSTEHTPGPWDVTGSDENGAMVVSQQNVPDPTVQSVNERAELIAALEAVAATLEGPVGDRLTGDTMAKTGAYDAIERARAAIKQAKGDTP